MEYNVNVAWDDEAYVWVATSGDIPGLVLECGSFDALIERVRYAAPELLGISGSEQRPLIRFKSECLAGMYT